MLGRNGRTDELETTLTKDRALLVHNQTAAFREKRQFRAYREFTTNVTLRLVAERPFLLTHQMLWTGRGAARAVITTGSTPSGVWDTLPTNFCKYLLDGPVVGTTPIFVGGSATGGQEREVLATDSGSGGGQGNPMDFPGERALPAGTYYITIAVTGTTYGMYIIEYEEIPV